MLFMLVHMNEIDRLKHLDGVNRDAMHSMALEDKAVAEL